ncbi:MAG: DUF6602 domain-containing protein [Candidatus Zixiibacteriota bacterium]
MNVTENRKVIDLRSVFLALQQEMVAGLSKEHKTMPHPGAKGDVSELRWEAVLSDYLPERYEVNKAFVVDCDGRISDHIDFVIYDRHYCPFLLHDKGAKYIPAESVYAVFEIKQVISKRTIQYAGNKAASVRRLKRTSVPIPYAAGKYPPKPQFRVLAGILTLKSDWSPPLGEPFESAIRVLEKPQQIDLGCALKDGAFELKYVRAGKVSIERSGQDDALIFFFLRLLSRLQALGTVPAIDIEQYGRSLSSQ